MRHIRSVIIGSIVSAALAAVPVSFSRAEMQILETNVPRYTVGTTVPDGTAFNDLGPNCYIRVLMLPSKETRLFEGPKTRTPPPLGTRDVLLPC
jgi:hypothetical protein